MTELTCDNTCQHEWRLYWVTLSGAINITVAVFGLVLNSIGIHVMQKTNENHLFRSLLISLLSFDTGVLVTTFLSSLHSMEICSVILAYLFPYFIHPFFYIFVCCSIITTVAITFERFKTLKDPIMNRNKNLSPSYKDNMLKRHICISLVVSFIYNIVRFFEYKVEHVPDYIYDIYVSQNVMINTPSPSVEHITKNGKWQSIVQQQEIYHNSSFRTVVAITDSIVLGFVPLVILTYLNFSIYRMVRKEKKNISRVIDVPLNPKTQDERKFNGVTSDDIKMAVVLMAIVAVFIFCYLFWLLHAILYAIWCTKCNLEPKQDSFCSIQYEGFYYFFDYGGRILITFNSSINVLLYGIIQKNFRKEMKEVLSKNWKTLRLNLITVMNKTIP